MIATVCVLLSVTSFSYPHACIRWAGRLRNNVDVNPGAREYGGYRKGKFPASIESPVERR
jgi:hypothetical protein